MTPSWLIAIQTAAIVISAVAAVFLVLSYRAQSKKRATVEMLLTLRLDSDYINLRNKFTELIKIEENLAQYASKQHSKNENLMHISRFLITMNLLQQEYQKTHLMKKYINAWPILWCKRLVKITRLCLCIKSIRKYADTFSGI